MSHFLVQLAQLIGLHQNDVLAGLKSFITRLCTFEYSVIKLILVLALVTKAIKLPQVVDESPCLLSCVHNDTAT